MAKTTFSGPVQSLGGFEDANGDPISGGGTPGGSNAQVQVNNNGEFAGISEGTSGQFLTSNGSGTASTFQTYTPNLTSYSVATAPTSGNSVGDLIYTTDGDSGQPTIAVWDGSNWIGVSNTRSTISAGGGA